ncbi:MAG: response regulator [Deltaproteobacteria bacterium]|jgi:signal transduction histidine kinase/CheY-like chemotaxis protein|nr:response regulator [Deltaproteobacteria bacterium]
MSFLKKEYLATPTFFVSAVIMLLISVYIITLMNVVTSFMENNIEEKLVAQARLAATLATSDELERFQTPEDMETPEYAALKERLIGFAEEINVLYVYYMRLNDDGMAQFIIDNDLTEDTVSLLSEPIDVEPSPLKAFEGHADTPSLGNYSVGYAGLLSAFSPVFDGEGRVTAIAGVDIPDEIVLTMQTRVRTTAILLAVAMLAVLTTGLLGLHLYRNKAKQSEAANLSKSQFLANMSHEIRTPLNAIIGLSEIELQKNLNDETRSDLEKIFTSGTNLLSIINDILDISKIEAGAFEIVPVDFETERFMIDLVSQNIVRIGKKDIKFVLEIDANFPAKLHGDEVRLSQILTNILSNAFKYTKRGTVSMKVSRLSWDTRVLAVFSVADTGIGIDPADLERLFREYIQLDAKANRHIEGTGLGLSITKRLLDLLDGSISVESKHGVGSAFTVKIPFKTAGNEVLGPDVANSLMSYDYTGVNRKKSHSKKDFVRSKIPGGKVLIVDDLDVNILVAKGLLKNYGLKIDTALSGLEAIEKVKEVEDGPDSEKYDIIFMDHMMPVMDGVEATHIIRTDLSSEYSKKVPIIALTANAVAGSKEMFLENGFSSFISKPINVVQLDEELNRWRKEKPTT